MEETLFSPPANGEMAENFWTGESLELSLLDGRKIVGKYVAFDSFRNLLEVSLEVRGKTAQVGFKLSEIRLVHLVAAREWVADTSLEARALNGLEQSQHKLKFRVLMKDGKDFTGSTFGFRVNRYGLCLFPTRGESGYTCMFVPHATMASYEVGPRIGEVLVRENLVSEAQLNDYLNLQQEERNRPLGDYLSSNLLVSVEEVEKALDLQKTFPNLKLGEILVSENRITDSQLSEALEQQKKNRERPLGEILVEAGLVTKRDIQLALAKKLGIPFVDLRKFPVDRSLFKLVPEEVARKLQVLPLFERGKRLAVALINPLDYKVIDTLQFHTGKIIEAVIAQEEELVRSIDLAYSGAGLSEILSDEYLWEEKTEDVAPGAEQEMEGVGGVIIKLVNKLVMDAYLDGVSDIHIEPRGGQEKTLVRFRRDGLLRNYYEVPAELRHALVARLKVMANLDISIKRKPQDGKISFGKFSPVQIDLRMATLPTAGGEEDVVLRILGANKPLPIGQLGLSVRDRRVVAKITAQPYGLFLVCGPTGSGKTTSLHSILGTINTAERKIWTAEDPVEITQPGLRQLQINPKVDLTFAAAMRSFLRADPDVIMVGEMRDRDTTRIGIEASLTGHLVLSTLHTNSAPESLVRLIDMGMDPFNFADALLGVMSQRLVRTLCASCKQEYPAGEEELRQLYHEYARDLPDEGAGAGSREADTLAGWRREFGDADGNLSLCRPVGCDDCDNSGYRGRMGVYELLEGTKPIKKLIIEGAPVSQLQRLAIEEGMRTLRQDGVEKILRGYTDLVQVRKVCVS